MLWNAQKTKLKIMLEIIPYFCHVSSQEGYVIYEDGMMADGILYLTMQEAMTAMSYM
jgi:hypothetical protein